jgi:hypothetical protein
MGADVMGRPHKSWRRVSAALLAGCAFLGAACGFPIGESVEQRELMALSFGSGPKVVLLIGGLHTGSEDNTRLIVEGLAAHTFCAASG